MILMSAVCVSAIENMIVNATKARQPPTGRYMARVEKQRAFNRAFPTIIQSNLANRYGVPPVVAASCDRRHSATADERKLAFLIDDPAKRRWEPSGFRTRHYHAGYRQLASERFAF